MTGVSPERIGRFHASQPPRYVGEERLLNAAHYASLMSDVDRLGFQLQGLHAPNSRGFDGKRNEVNTSDNVSIIIIIIIIISFFLGIKDTED